VLLHGLTYFRWSSNAQSFAVLRASLARVGVRVGDRIRYEVPASDPSAPRATPRYLGLPFLFERDVVMWALFLVTVLPGWDVGMLVLGSVLVLRGLEMNWYAVRKLRRGEDNLALVLNPDYH